MASATKTVRTFLHPRRDAEPRSSGSIVAKDTKAKVQSLLVDGDTIVVSHHEGLARSPGGITIRRRSDFKVVRKTKGSSGPIVPFGDAWMTEGLLWRGNRASTHFLDPATLECLERHPLCGPFVVRDEHRFIASTPSCALALVPGGGVKPSDFKVDPAIVRSSWVKLPTRGGLVEIDTRKKKTELVVANDGFDDFRHAAISPDRDVLYAATGFGRILAVRLEDREILWERPAMKTVMEWSGYALALDPGGTWLAIAGASQSGFDHLVFDARTGRVETQARLCDMVNNARVATTKTVRIEALAFHPTGWLAAATNAGVIVELRPSGDVSAFRGATRGIEALAFCDDGRALLVGGAEPNLRVWPVDIEGEARVRMVTVDDPKAKTRTRVITSG
jgi:hypothetical protein